MTTGRAIILGDPHIGRSLSQGKPGIGSSLNSRIIDQLSLLDWTLETTLNTNAGSIIITGDVFEDPKPHPMFISLFMSWLKKCEANNIIVHIIVGNHDILRSGQFYTSPLDVISEADLNGIHVYKNMTTITLDGVGYTLMPFRDRRSLNALSPADGVGKIASTIPFERSGIPSHYAKVAIGHFAVEGSIPIGDEIDDLHNELFIPAKMFTGYDYVWLGHIHKPQVMSKDPYVAHIGSMDLSDFGESSHDKILVLFDPDASKPYEEIKIPTRPLYKISVSVPEKITDTTTYVLDEITNNFKSLNKGIIKINVDLTSSELLSINRKTIEQKVYDLGAFHIAGFSESKKMTVIKKTNVPIMTNTTDEVTAIKNYSKSVIDKDDQPKFEEMALSLLEKFKSSVKS